MDPKGQSLSLIFCGVCVLALLQMLFYNWVMLVAPKDSRFLLMWWLATGLGFLGFYGVGRTLAIDLQGNLRAALLVIFSGAFIGCTIGMVPLFLTEPFWSLAILWNFLSPFILQISFMAFTAVSLAHFRLQGLPLFQFNGGVRRRGTELDSTVQPLFRLFVVVFFLGIIKDGLYWATLLWVQNVQGLIIFWLGVAGMFFGWYWEGPKIKLDLTTNLPLALLVLLSGAYGGSAMIPLLLEIGHWILVSPWFLQIFFMAFTVVSIVHLQSQ